MPKKVVELAETSSPVAGNRQKVWQVLLKWLVIFAALAGTVVAATEYIHLLRSLTVKDWHLLSISTVLTFARVIAAVVLASLWTIPVGVMIGRSARWSNRLQPIIQMVASFPAPMIFPVVIGIFFALGGSLGIGSIFLLMLGTQWYVLFNVISGASAIPRELWEVTKLQGVSTVTTWKRLILPAIFPALLTGWITAMGGAWNATIVAEYTTYNDHDISTVGLGALISQAADGKNFALLGAAVGIMSFTVVLINRFVWRPLSRQAQTRFGMDA
jgi:NitT/TauT family transport system permease protein